MDPENSCAGRFLESRKLLRGFGEVQGALRNSGVDPEFLIEWFLNENRAQVEARGLRPATFLRPVLSNLSTVGAGLV